MTTKQMGQGDFRWFVGIVEDRDDPQKFGRVKVRIYGLHGDSVEAPTDELPWATPITPVTSSSLNTVGISPTGIQVGSTVVGFFFDGNEAQMPIILGTLTGVQDMVGLAVGEQVLNKKRLGPEPKSAFAAAYPFNKVTKTESGHVLEVDDTPAAQRLHAYHRSGTYVEINSKGDRVDKIVRDGYEIIANNQHVYVGGNVNVTVKGNVSIVVDGTYTVESKGNMAFKAPRIDLN